MAYEEWVDVHSTKILQKAAVVDAAGNILMLQRSENTEASRPGKWDLPGGNFDQQDLSAHHPLIKAMTREVQEETGLQVDTIHAIITDSWTMDRSGHNVLGVAVGYQAHITETTPDIVLSDEHSDYAWLPQKQAAELDFGDDGGFHASIIQAIAYS